MGLLVQGGETKNDQDNIRHDEWEFGCPTKHMIVLQRQTLSRFIDFIEQTELCAFGCQLR